MVTLVTPSWLFSHSQENSSDGPAQFIDLLKSFPLILQRLNNPPLIIVDSGGLFKLGKSTCKAINEHPALWEAVQGFFIWQVTRHIVEVAKRDPDSRAAFPLLSLKMFRDPLYFSISFRDENLKAQADLVIKQGNLLSFFNQ